MTGDTYENRPSIQQQCDKARADALMVARDSNALRMLVAAGEWKAARWVAEKLYWDDVRFNGGGGAWNRITYDMMTEAALEAQS